MSTPSEPGAPGGPELLLVADAASWRAWLNDNHRTPAGVWLVLAKQGATDPTSLNHAQALDEALCHGWIDGQVKRRDDATFVQRFTPRRDRSIWSQRNIGHIERLEHEGRMHPSGLAEVERAKVDGRWEAAYAGPASIEIPPDVADALAAAPGARAMFDVLTSQNRYAILFRLTGIKRPEARARRIAQYVAMLERGETIYPQRAQRPDPDGPGSGWGDTGPGKSAT